MIHDVFPAGSKTTKHISDDRKLELLNLRECCVECRLRSHVVSIKQVDSDDLGDEDE